MRYKLQVLGLALGLVVFTVFGVGVLNNIHNGYLRLLSSWTVMITNSQGTSGATGFIVKGASGRKFILTNGHVCRLAEKGVLTANYGDEKFPVSVFKEYEWNDLCALEAHRPLGHAITVARSVRLGEQVYVIGHPLLEPLTVRSGEISGTVILRIMMGQNPTPESCTGPTYSIMDTSKSIFGFFGINTICMRTLEANAGTADTLPGNSGSPIVNTWGNLVAVCFAGNQSGTRSYSVPLADIKDFLSEL